MGWADRQMIDALHAAPVAQAEALPLLAHVLAAEHIWLARLETRDAQLPVWPSLAVDECQRVAAENAAGYLALLERTGDGQLTDVMRYQNTKGQQFATPVIDILIHVVIHGAYHRGQIAKILGRHGAASPNTDFITFARDVEPPSVR